MSLLVVINMQNVITSWLKYKFVIMCLINKHFQSITLVRNYRRNLVDICLWEFNCIYWDKIITLAKEFYKCISNVILKLYFFSDTINTCFYKYAIILLLIRFYVFPMISVYINILLRSSLRPQHRAYVVLSCIVYVHYSIVHYYLYTIAHTLLYVTVVFITQYLQSYVHYCTHTVHCV